jgi:hypothetical protein
MCDEQKRIMKMKDIKSVRLAPYRRALERVGAALRANRGGPSDRELLYELRKKLFGVEILPEGTAGRKKSE